jgi:hypothetical protein
MKTLGFRIGSRGTRLGLLGLALLLPACTDLSGLRDDLANPCGSGGCHLPPPTCDQLDAFVWVVRGFDFGDLAPGCTGSECAVVLKVGDTRQLFIESASVSGVDCTGSIASVEWSVSLPSVAELEPNGPTRALLTAIEAGETTLSADLSFSDGRQRRAQPHVSSIRIVTIKVTPR